MAEGDKLLTDEEMEAIEEVVASGNLGEGYNIGIDATVYDLTARENQPALDSEVLEQINTRLQRHLRLSLLKELKYDAMVSAEAVEVAEYGEYIQKISSPSSLSVTKISPLKGECLCVLDAQVVYSCVDNWFGGSPRPLSGEAASREFSRTEEVVAKKVRLSVYSALLEAWAPSLEVQCEFMRSEVNPFLVNLLAEDEQVVVTRFKMGGGNETLGSVDIVYPLDSVKLLRGSMVKVVETKEPKSRLEQQWASRLRGALDEIPFEAVVNAGEIPISFADLANLKVGDTIPFKNIGRSELSVNGLSIFEVEIGSAGDNAAVKLMSSIASENTV